jgi:hypothetical protein
MERRVKENPPHADKAPSSTVTAAPSWDIAMINIHGQKGRKEKFGCVLFGSLSHR